MRETKTKTVKINKIKFQIKAYQKQFKHVFEIATKNKTKEFFKN